MKKVEIQKDGKITVRYEYSFEIEEEKLMESVELGIIFGRSDDKLVVAFEHEGGNRLYYKKVVKEIKKLYANCLA